MDGPRDYHTKIVRQRKTNILWYHFYMESKKREANSEIQRTDWWLPEVGVLLVVQSLNCVWLFATPWAALHQALLSSSISWSLLKFMSIELVMLWRPTPVFLPGEPHGQYEKVGRRGKQNEGVVKGTNIKLPSINKYFLGVECTIWRLYKYVLYI